MRFSLLIIVGLVLKTFFAKGTDRESPIVEVRAVFINCEPEEREDISVDNAELRFEREELFKHSVLQDCKKKMALTVKIATDSEPVAGDEYIPIEHVFQGQNKRVRLLNPYVLRLQRGTLLQAYKLKRIDTVTGIMENMNTNYKLKEKNGSGVRSKRSEKQNNLTNDEDQNNQNCELTDKSTLDTCLNKRIKRNEHNIVVENTSKGEKYSPWKPYDDEKNRKSHSFYTSSTIVSLPDKKFEKLNDEMTNSETYQKKSVELQQRSIPWGSYKSGDSNTKNGNSRNSNVESDWDLEENTGSPPESTKDSYSKEQYNDKIDREFDVYEIGTPDLLYNVNIQLFEKLTNTEGNTLWNDMTKGEPASVSTLAPEWAGQDLIMRYHPMEWIPREEFTLPSTNLCLLALVYVQKNLETDGTNDDAEKYIVVPKEDIMNIENKDVKVKKLEYSAEQNEQHKRRVMIRTTRAIYCREGDRYRVTTIRNTPFLTIAHRRPHHVQIDVEARADENQLVPVGFNMGKPKPLMKRVLMGKK